MVEYSPAEIKRSVVGYGRAEKQQVQAMMKLLLGLDAVPSPHDVADALAVAICHIHTSSNVGRPRRPRRGGTSRAPCARGATTGPDAPLPLDDRPSSAAWSPRRRRAASIVDVAGVGYDVLVPLSTFYVPRRTGRGGDAADPHPRARRRHRAVRLRHAAGAGSLRTADLDQRHRAEAGAGGAVGHRAGGADSRHPHPGRGAADRAFPASARRPPSGSGSS